jgi:hypothetical protein
MIRRRKHIIWDWKGTVFCDVHLGIEIMSGLLHETGCIKQVALGVLQSHLTPNER